MRKPILQLQGGRVRGGPSFLPGVAALDLAEMDESYVR